MMEGDLKILEGYLTKEIECVPYLQLVDLLLVYDGLWSEEGDCQIKLFVFDQLLQLFTHSHRGQDPHLGLGNHVQEAVQMTIATTWKN